MRTEKFKYNRNVYEVMHIVMVEYYLYLFNIIQLPRVHCIVIIIYMRCILSRHTLLGDICRYTYTGISRMPVLCAWIYRAWLECMHSVHTHKYNTEHSNSRINIVLAEKHFISVYIYIYIYTYPVTATTVVATLSRLRRC